LGDGQWRTRTFLFFETLATNRAGCSPAEAFVTVPACPRSFYKQDPEYNGN
jgi:hypothetical protein